eukprot:10170651-Alexandrium_andersonii.AAC.1
MLSLAPRARRHGRVPRAPFYISRGAQSPGSGPRWPSCRKAPQRRQVAVARSWAGALRGSRDARCCPPGQRPAR